MDGKKEALLITGLAGEKKLRGEIAVRGAKNAALKAIAASALFADPLPVSNLPVIADVERMKDLLVSVGASVSGAKRRIVISLPRELKKAAFDPGVSRRLRASVVATGPLLARTGRIVFPHPGGCVIGARPIDLFLEGFARMGARVSFDKRRSLYTVSAPKGGLRGAHLFFRTQSVTATETFMMAAVLASGVTRIHNAAMEPEIVHLADFLNACGARIRGAGTPFLSVSGGRLLRARTRAYRTPPDRIEAGSFLLLAALAARDVTVSGCNPRELESLLEIFSVSGVPFSVSRSSVSVFGGRKKNKEYTPPAEIRTHEYPGFPTDLQAPMTVFLTQSGGETVVFETIFEGRLSYTEEIVRMGAHITMMDTHRILVKGPTLLRGREMESPDLRAGLSFIIAAAVAKGRSIVHNVSNIDRGYEDIESRLRALGLSIERKETEV